MRRDEAAMRQTLLLMQPQAALIDALCEHTCDLAVELAHVQSARLVERHVGVDGVITLVQHWRALAGVPQLLRPHLEDGLQDWTLTIQRSPGASQCRWHAESAAVQVPGRCQGTLDFQPAAGGRGTRIELRFEFQAAHEGLRTIFGTLLARHWRALAEAAARRVAASAAAPAG
jgi:hypothetical protein